MKTVGTFRGEPVIEYHLMANGGTDPITRAYTAARYLITTARGGLHLVTAADITVQEANR